MKINKKLLSLLNQAIRENVNKWDKKGNALFYCPFCKHYKRKLTINIDSNSDKYGNYQCWVCNTNGKSIYSLFKKLNVSEKIIDKLKNVYKSKSYFNSEDTNKNKYIRIPSDYICLSKASENLFYTKALNYLISRGVTWEDILRYEIGYSINGKHEGYIIVPSYDSNGELNYYYTRKYQENRGYKTINPPFSKNDIIFFESLINFEEEITLVESVFDAISIRRNAVPLMGKKLSEVLLMKLVENKPPRINIMLDGDAKSDAIKIAKTLMENGLDVYLIFLNEKDDPNDLGFDQCWDYIKNITTQVTNLDLIQYKTRLR